MKDLEFLKIRLWSKKIAHFSNCIPINLSEIGRSAGTFSRSMIECNDLNNITGAFYSFYSLSGSMIMDLDSI